MSKSEILKELPKLTPEDRQELRLDLAELDSDDWLDCQDLTEGQKTSIVQRSREMDVNPEGSIPWDQARERLLSAFRKRAGVWRSAR